MSDTEQFYYAFKHGEHCVMDRDAGVEWDCIQLRREPGESAEQWVRRAVDALNNNDQFEEVLPVPGRCRVGYCNGEAVSGGFCASHLNISSSELMASKRYKKK